MEKEHHKDEALILEVFNKSAEAWNTKNITLFTSLYTRDVDYITFMGEHIQGLDANIRLHRELWSSYFIKGATLEGEVISVKFPDKDTAVMIAKGGIKLRFHKKMPSGRLSVNTTVLVRQQGEWKICSFQNTRLMRFSPFMRFMMWIDKKITEWNTK